MTSTSEYLKFYSEKNWLTFPVKPRSKFPLIPNAHPEGDPLHKQCKGGCGKYGHGLYDATTELNLLNGWLEQYPNMNIGIATGKKSKVFVLDIDPKHNGYQTLDELEKNHGSLPKTPTVQTGGGGKHYFFKYPDFDIHNIQESDKMQGIDVRGEGGYVVAAGSIHENGNPYKWIIPPSQVEVADAPKWLLDILQKPKEKKINPVPNFIPAIPNGGRNNTLTMLAGSMRRKGMSAESIYQALLIENKTKCVPPLSDQEVKNIADSVTRYQPAIEFDNNRDRLQTEWAFCKSIFEFPMSVSDFLDITPEMFADHTLQDFWKGVVNNEDVTKCAVDANILTELERYTNYDYSRLDGYARAIKRYAHLAKIEKHAKDIAFSAKHGDDMGIEKSINELNKVPSQVRSIISIGDVAESVEEKIRERALNPVDVWGIPYAWNRLSKITGGKQKGELILHSAEPKIGKSWFWLQDALETSIREIPVFYWCGEMKRHQLMMRFYQLLGVNGRNMKSGNMTPNDWDLLTDAKALILNSPLYIDDSPLMLHELRPLLAKQKAEHGIEQFIIDYAMKIQAPGKDETEQTANISKEVKNICNDLELAGTLITSVNKQGFEAKTENTSKGNVRGSGQQIHDADIIYIMTKFNGEKWGVNYGIKPSDYDKVISVHFAAGRELDHQVEGGFIPYMREENSPKFKELSPV